jgi:hypothetical protein
MEVEAAEGDDCNIDSEGYCIFTGTPHQTGLQPDTNNVVDRQGNFLFSISQSVAANSTGEILQASGRPAFDGDDLIEYSQENLSEDEKAFHKVMAIMYPIRNALMYDIGNLTQSQWEILVMELEIREIKETTYTDGPTPKDNYYGRQGVFDLAKDPDGKDITNEVMKFLEEGSIYLLCHVTSDEFNQMLQDSHPEGHNPCSDAEITVKIPFDGEGLLAGQCTCPDGSKGQMVGPADDDGVDDGCLCGDSVDESPLPSVSLIPALISIGIIALRRRS